MTARTLIATAVAIGLTAGLAGEAAAQCRGGHCAGGGQSTMKPGSMGSQPQLIQLQAAYAQQMQLAQMRVAYAQQMQLAQMRAANAQRMQLGQMKAQPNRPDKTSQTTNSQLPVKQTPAKQDPQVTPASGSDR